MLETCLETGHRLTDVQATAPMANSSLRPSSIDSRPDRIRYDARRHTRQALLDQVSSVLAHDSAPILIGSLGRAAATASEKEFRLRGETAERKSNGLARDIDLFLPTCGALRLESCPFPVDSGPVTAHDQRIVLRNGDYWLVDELLRISVRLNEDVFAPTRAHLFGELDVRTFSSLTQYALLFVIFETPRQYVLVRRFMEEHFSRSGLKPAAELYRPFFEFRRKRRLSLLNQARTLYRGALPVGLRYRFHPLIRRMVRSMSFSR